ncbi:MAG: response regulator [Bacteroidota bacterium]|jgi:DNA-binding response OmpR family regulator
MAESWKKKIFVVDDDPMFIMSIKGLLTGAGYDVDTAMTGKDALEKLGKGMPDLIIIDVIMKDMNGFVLTRAIREVDKKVPIIILTGMRAESDKFEAKLAGANEYMNKPVAPDDLLRRMKSLMGPVIR